MLLILLMISLIKQEIISDPKVDCHTATVTAMSGNDLACTWYQAETEGYGNFEENTITDIYFKRFAEGVWQPSKLIAHHKKRSWNSVVVYTPEKELLLFYKVGDSPRQWVGILTKSSDDGVTFSEPKVLPAGVLGPVHAKPIFHFGRMLCPSSLESGEAEDQYRACCGWIDSTSDNGDTWEKFGPIVDPAEPFSLIQPTLFVDHENAIHLLARNRAFRVGKIGSTYHSISYDAGKHWKPATTIDIPNPDSSLEVLRLKQGPLLLAHQANSTARDHLILSISEDEGKTWKSLWTLAKATGEYFYPSITQTEDGHIHVLFGSTDKIGTKRCLVHVELELNS